MFDKIILYKGELRPILRFLISVLGILTVSGVVDFIAFNMPLIQDLGARISLAFWSKLLMLPSLLALYALLARFLERRPLGSVGLAFYGRWKNELGIGLISGAGMILAVGGLEWLLGGAKFSLSGGPPGHVAFMGAGLVLLLGVAAAEEELIFRGYPFQRLVDSCGPVLAIGAVSVLFGLAHLWNPSPNWISTGNTILAGVLFAVCYLRTRALWLPIGLHFTWNYFQGFVLGLPVSGWSMPQSILAARVQGPHWLTGGAYGPEGSILSSGIILAATLYFLFTRRIYVTREMQELVLGPRSEEDALNSIAPRDILSTEKQ